MKSVSPKISFPKLEEDVLSNWAKEKIFERSVAMRKGKKKYVFFDGPPFANGLPHYGHLLANTIKDTVTRYWNMRGYYVPRTNGWDCHGLPVEYEIEKELGISGKKQIEDLGIEVFNKKCRESVFRYTKEWEQDLRRLGRWVDFNDTYATLDVSYMESIWWVFSAIWDKKMIYEGWKAMQICPRCETPLSNFEVTQAYKEVVDTSMTAKFSLRNEKNTYFLAWTTTPWSFISVMALAVGPNIDYVKVQAGDEYFYIAKKLREKVFAGIEHKVVEEMKGKKLLNIPYRHLFSYYENRPEIKQAKHVYHTVPTDYVSDEDGTGIATINPAYGDIDFQMGLQYKLPIIVEVKMDGTYSSEVKDFAGLFVKDAEPKIAEYLKKKNLLFKKEPYKHSYPHCWRCDSPLLNYVTRSLFVKVTDVKKELLNQNKKIHWQPWHLQEGRFGKWLEGARDWAISRNRFWGAPIPMWECKKCKKKECVGSLQEMENRANNEKTELVVVRHGETDWNKKDIWQGTRDIPMNAAGRAQVRKTANLLAKEKFDFIFCSDLSRAQETAKIINEKQNLTIEITKDLREKSNGKLEGMTTEEIYKKFPEEIKKREQDYYNYRYPGGDGAKDAEARVKKFITHIMKVHRGKKILVVTHEGVLRHMRKEFENLSWTQMRNWKPKNGALYRKIILTKPNFPSHYQTDLHRPYIDDIAFTCACGGKMKRTPDVLDCWFESGAMPYGQLHYPFENKKEFEKNFPAEFIAEGLDQTRGWFYTLHVLATTLFKKPAFKNVITNGILLAEDGEKLSKRKKNYPDPQKIFNTHGVDSLRFFLVSSPAALGDEVRFSEKFVDGTLKQFFIPLWNAYSFFTTYASIDKFKPEHSEKLPKNTLDQWILSELALMTAAVEKASNDYNLPEATRPLTNFVDELTDWYIRRSRRRFWKSGNTQDKREAYQTLYTVLKTFAQCLAPFAPFVSDAMYRNLTGEDSVHLTDWPKLPKSWINKKFSHEMNLVRAIVSLGHNVRAQHQLKVRQPLASVSIVPPRKLYAETLKAYREVICEELNVKELKLLEKPGDIAELRVRPDPRKLGPKYGKEVQQILATAREGDAKLTSDGKVKVGKWILEKDEVEVGYEGKEGMAVGSDRGIVVALDTKITEDLKAECIARDLVRIIQELRKDAGYDVSDRIYLFIQGHDAVVTQFADYIKKETLALELQVKGDFPWDKEKKETVSGEEVVVGVRKS